MTMKPDTTPRFDVAQSSRNPALEQSPAREMVEDLLALLGQEIRLLQKRHEQFCELYEVILKRNNERMETLLEEMTRLQQDQADLDGRLQAVRGVLARAIGAPEDAMRLGDLAHHLDPSRAQTLQSLRNQIIQLAEKLERKHLDTAVLLSECARVNRMLLEGLLPAPETVQTYGQKGNSPWSAGAGLVDAEM